MSQFHGPQGLPVLVRPSAKVSVCFLTYSYIIIIIPLWQKTVIYCPCLCCKIALLFHCFIY